jgi:hypothetical protein
VAGLLRHESMVLLLVIAERIHRFSSSSRSERGSILVVVAIWLPVLLIFAVFVIDVGNWFEHKRHLQLQVDAGALAGGSQFELCPAEWLGGGTAGSDQISATTRKYAGDPAVAGAYNLQVGGANKGAMTILVNSKLYALGAPPAADNTVENPPCQAEMVDVKGSETGLPLFFSGLIPGLASVRRISAHARVELRTITGNAAALPIGVPDPGARSAVATFVNDATGAALSGCTDAASGVSIPSCTVPLVKRGVGGNGQSNWDNGGAGSGDAGPIRVPINVSNVGVRVALAGVQLCDLSLSPQCGSGVSAASGSATCSQALVECFDATGLSLVQIRGWASTPSGQQPNAPQIRSVQLSPGTGCSDPYFVSSTQPCPNVRVNAHVDIGNLAVGSAGITVSGPASCPTNGNNTGCPLTHQSGDLWTSADIPISGTTTIPYTLHWKETAGSVKIAGVTTPCGTGGNPKPCTGDFSPSPVRKTYFATDANSGQLKLVQAWNYDTGAPGTFWADSFQTNATPNTHQLVVKISITGSLKDAQSVADPIVSLRVQGNQNQSLDCDPNISNLEGELAGGCGPQYVTNDGSVNCNSVTQTALWNSAQPWMCVAIDTGNATNQVPKGLNTRILGSQSPNTCPAAGALGHNNWSMFPNFLANDPRIVEVFVTPFGSFSGTGNNTTVTVEDFAFFYITGWTAQGNGFKNPCQAPGKGDDPVPNNDSGLIVGHFIKYVASMNSGGGSPTLCDPNGFSGCVAVLTN